MTCVTLTARACVSQGGLEEIALKVCYLFCRFSSHCRNASKFILLSVEILMLTILNTQLYIILNHCTNYL